MQSNGFEENFKGLGQRPIATLAFILSALSLASDLIGIISSYDVALTRVNVLWSYFSQSSGTPLWNAEVWPMRLCFYTALSTITYYDLKEGIIPHAVTIPGILLGLGMTIGFRHISVLDAFLGAAVGFILPYLFVIIPRKFFDKDALGMGVPYMYSMVGAYIGLQKFWTFFLMSWIIMGFYSLIYVIYYLIRYRVSPMGTDKTFETGPFIALWALIYTSFPIL